MTPLSPVHPSRRVRFRLWLSPDQQEHFAHRGGCARGLGPRVALRDDGGPRLFDAWMLRVPPPESTQEVTSQDQSVGQGPHSGIRSLPLGLYWFTSALSKLGTSRGRTAVRQ